MIVEFSGQICQGFARKGPHARPVASINGSSSFGVQMLCLWDGHKPSPVLYCT